MERQALSSFARQAGADVIGVASIDRFEGLPAQHDPLKIFPETKSVIVLGRRINRGALRGPEEGTQFHAYGLYGDEWLDNRFISHMTYKVTEWLEDQGWESVPLMNLPPEIPAMGVPVRQGQTPPNVMVDAVDAAVRAGIGEIGWCGFLLTPRFGPRQRLQVILTDAEIEPDPISPGQTICLHDSGCRGMCPLSAMAGQKVVEICGKKMKVADIQWDRCGQCKNGARPNRYHGSGKPDRMASVCARTCVDNLEKAERVSNRFVSGFRKRPAWTIGADMDLYKI